MSFHTCWGNMLGVLFTCSTHIVSLTWCFRDTAELILVFFVQLTEPILVDCPLFTFSSFVRLITFAGFCCFSLSAVFVFCSLFAFLAFLAFFAFLTFLPFLPFLPKMLIFAVFWVPHIGRHWLFCNANDPKGGLGPKMGLGDPLSGGLTPILGKNGSISVNFGQFWRFWGHLDRSGAVPLRK